MKLPVDDVAICELAAKAATHSRGYLSLGATSPYPFAHDFSRSSRFAADRLTTRLVKTAGPPGGRPRPSGEMPVCTRGCRAGVVTTHSISRCDCGAGLARDV